MDNKVVLEIIKSEFLLKNENKNIRIPSGVILTLVDNSIKMHLSNHAVSSNMQKDSGSFEGWALVLKRWGKYTNIILSWEKPDDINNGHYQRFLFRLENFSKNFGSWFTIETKCIKLLDDIKIKASNKYILNLPSKRGEKIKPKPEAILERRFVEGDLKGKLQNLTQATILARQLPVGVFIDSVKKNNSIFTGGGSAIDIWGINKNNELLVFELKAENNSKIGIITELYFYVCVLQRLRSKQFKHKKLSEENEVLSQIPNTKKINAFFLTKELHPLIDRELILLLNSSSDKEVFYQNIKIDPSEQLSLS